VLSNEEDYFEISDLPNGKYEITVSAVGFENSTEPMVLNNSRHEINKGPGLLLIQFVSPFFPL
jgi:hypothetical protein